jgi:anti-sigma B factor antagonist
MDASDGDSAAHLTISAAREASRLVITLDGELDLSNVRTLDEALQREVQDRPEEVVFDLARLRFMDSSGIAALLRARDEFGAVTLRSPTNIIRRVITGTGLGEVLPMEP